MKTVTIFGSSIPGEGTEVYKETQQLGRRLAEAGFAVCNGGYGGLMEASARGARESGGHTIGVTCNVWPAAANRWIAEEVRTPTFMQRLLTLIERGDSYIVLPGGTGTLAELALEMLFPADDETVRIVSSMAAKLPVQEPRALAGGAPDA